MKARVAAPASSCFGEKNIGEENAKNKKNAIAVVARSVWHDLVPLRTACNCKSRLDRIDPV
jgi:hypothetical protein